jgi:hypothetical protein
VHPGAKHVIADARTDAGRKFAEPGQVEDKVGGRREIPEHANLHLAHDPALVFSAMNIGVIVLATLVGVWWLGERLGRLNRLGLVLAVVAVWVLATA